MEILKIIGFLLVWIRSGECVVECMTCDEVKTVDECIGRTVTCGDGEQCFLEKVTTDALQVVYNAGCRSKTVCEIMRQLGSGVGRKKRLVNCAECCSTPQGARVPCNARLCSANPHVTIGDECLVCTRGVAAPSACTNREVCQDTQMCSTSITWEGAVRYYYTCERRDGLQCDCYAYNKYEVGNNRPSSTHQKPNSSKQDQIRRKCQARDSTVCERFINAGVSTTNTHNGRRAGGITMCSACCTGDRCNQEDCFQLRNNMTLALLGTNPPSTISSG